MDTVVWCLYVGYSISAEGHVFEMLGAYLFRAYASNVKLCTSVLSVTLFIPVSSYEVCILTS